jgi:hypothetical protein
VDNRSRTEVLVHTGSIPMPRIAHSLNSGIKASQRSAQSL